MVYKFLSFGGILTPEGENGMATKKMNRAVLPMAGIGMAAAAAATMGLVMSRPKGKRKVQHAAGKALKAVGEVMENFSGSMMKM